MFWGAARVCAALAVCAVPGASGVPAVPGVPGVREAAQAHPEGGTSVRDTLATVHGTVVEHGTGAPLAEATVSLASGPGGTRGVGTRVTDRSGVFLFRNVPPGSYALEVDLLGYLGRSDTIRVDAGGDVTILAELSASPIPLEPIQVVVRRPPPSGLGGFERRRKTMAGFFITRRQVEESHPRYVSDLFRMMPGASVGPSVYGADIRLRGGCRPDLWIDGVRTVSSVSLDELVTPVDVEAIEVYRGVELPARFGTSPCGAIIVWTRRPPRSATDGSIMRHLAIVAGFLLAAYMIFR
jgi:hypothetical protein